MKLIFKNLFIFIVLWTILNFLINEIALLLNIVFNPESYFEVDTFLTNIKYILIQTLIIGLFLLFVNIVLKAKNKSKLIYILFQIVTFHFVFFLNIVRNDNKFSFSTTFDNLGLQYLFLNSTELTFLFNVFIPNYGRYDGGMYIPDSTLIFYISHIVIPILYFIFLSLLTTKTIQFFKFDKNIVL